MTILGTILSTNMQISATQLDKRAKNEPNFVLACFNHCCKKITKLRMWALHNAYVCTSAQQRGFRCNFKCNNLIYTRMCESPSKQQNSNANLNAKRYSELQLQYFWTKILFYNAEINLILSGKPIIYYRRRYTM